VTRRHRPRTALLSATDNSRSGAWAPVAVAAAALVVKTTVLVQLGGHPLLQPLGELDSAFYVQLARSLATDGPLAGGEPFFVSPLYVYFLGAIFALGGSIEAARVGLDFLAITDHNTTSHFEEIATRNGDFLLIPGEEVTTAWGHANVWGLDAWVDFRCTDDAGMQRIIDFVHERGGLFSPNHPKPGYPWEFGLTGFRVTETWQGPWRLGNDLSREFWERRLREGERAVAVGGSDCHSIAPAKVLHPWGLGTPCTWVSVQGTLDETGVLDAVRAGHTFVSEDPTGPFLEFTAECDGASYITGDAIEAKSGAPVTFTLDYRGPSEKKLRLFRDGELWQEVVADREEQSFEFELALDAPGYVRAEVAGFRGRPERGEVTHALTNPIYLRPA